VGQKSTQTMKTNVKSSIIRRITIDFNIFEAIAWAANQTKII